MSNKKSLPHYLTIPRLSCLVLSVVTVALQCAPFWNINGKMYSISDLVLFIYKYPEFVAFLKSFNPANSVNQAIVVPVFLFISCFATFLAVFMSRTKGYAIAPTISAIIAVGGYLWKAELRGGNLWYLHILPPVIMCALAILDYFKVFDKKAAK